MQFDQPAVGVVEAISFFTCAFLIMALPMTAVAAARRPR